MFPKPISVKSIGKYRIALVYEDDTQGVIDLAEKAGKGVFSAWETIFDHVYIDPETQAIAWNEQLDICPDTLYLQLKGITFEQYKAIIQEYAYH